MFTLQWLSLNQMENVYYNDKFGVFFFLLTDVETKISFQDIFYTLN